MKIGLIREGKVPPDKRVALTPSQCTYVLQEWPGTVIAVQPSMIRAIRDEEYAATGIPVQEDLSDCDVLMGIKEVPIEQLIPQKTYFFFSHTHKKQPHNRDLLRAVLEKKIRLIDYELITDVSLRRLIGFGKYAGIVGTYNGFRAWGLKTGAYHLEPAYECFDRQEMERELQKVVLPKNFKLCFTGGGRVGSGAMEILHKMKIRQVFPTEYLVKEYDEPVFTQLNVEDYNERVDGQLFKRQEFFNHPVGYRSTFMRYAAVSDMYISCHFWDNRSPYIFTREDAKKPEFRIKVVADISCDIDCAVASTIRASAIENPFYGYDPQQEKEVDFTDPRAIGVMAVDNLPCELPRDASEDFGSELLKNVLPYLLGEDPDKIIERATIAKDGRLMERFEYLAEFAAET